MKTFSIALSLLSALLSAAPAHSTERFDFAFENDPSVPIVNISVAFRRGQSSDPKDLGGLTYVMGEMLLKGTRLRTKNQLELRLDELGSSIGMEVRNEFLVVRGTVLSANLKPYLELLNEILLQPSFPERELSKLKKKLSSEIINLRSSDSSLVRHHFLKLLFGDHPYSRQPFGTTSSLTKITRDRLQKHYLDTFSGSNMIVAGTGDTAPETLRNWANSLAESLPKESQPVLLSPVVAGTKPRLLIVDKSDRTQNPVIVGQVGIPFVSPDFFPLYVANFSFGGPTFSSRLMDQIRVKRGWSYGANSSFQYGSVPREWSYSFSPKTTQVAEALSYSLKMLQELKEKGITAAEFEFARESILSSSGFLYNTPDRRIENTLIEKTFHLPDGFFKSYAENVRKLTLDQVNDSLRHFIAPNTLAVTVVGSAKELKKPLADALGIPEGEVVVRPYTAE